MNTYFTDTESKKDERLRVPTILFRSGKTSGVMKVNIRTERPPQIQHCFTTERPFDISAVSKKIRNDQELIPSKPTYIMPSKPKGKELNT